MGIRFQWGRQLQDLAMAMIQTSSLSTHHNETMLGSMVAELATQSDKLDRWIARAQVILRNLQDVVAIHGVDGTFSWVSDNVYDLLGYHPMELIGTHPHELLHPQDARRVRVKHSARDLMCCGGELLRTESRVRHKKGHYVWMETIITPLYNGKPEPIAAQSHMRDISDRKKSDEVYARELSSHRIIFDDAPIPMSILSQDGYFVSANKAWTGLLGYSKSELTHLNVQDILDENSISAQVPPLNVFGGPEESGIFSRFIHKNGQTVDLYFWDEAIHNEYGDVLRRACMTQDVDNIRSLYELQEKYAGTKP